MIKVEYLEKVRQDAQDESKLLHKSIEMKENAYEELNREYRQIKQNFEKQNATLEQTMVAEIQEKD